MLKQTKRPMVTWILSLSMIFSMMSVGYVSAESVTTISEDTVIETTVEYVDGLIIEEGVTVTAPEGYELTLVDDGVEKNVEAGTYDGNVYLVITEEHKVQFMFAEHDFRMGLYINEGVVSEKSVTQVLDGITYDDTRATGGNITVEGDYFNGIVVGGDSDYAINDLTVDFTGNGGNDFAGYGAAIMSTDTANLVVDNFTANTDGVLDVAVFAGSNSTLLVKNSTIITGNADSTEGVSAPMMKEVPWLLGIYGNTRSTNVLGAADVTYENCYVEADSWGALSTDSCEEGASLTAIDTTVVVTTSGYGSYADGGVFNTYTNCDFDVPDYGLIVAAGQCGALFDGGSVINSDRFGIMWHKNQNGTVTITDGTSINTGETAFLIKSDTGNTAYPNLVVDGASVNADNGIILHLMESDDPGINPEGGGPGSDDMWSPSYTVPEVVPVEDDNDTTNPATETAVDTVFKNMTLTGDIYNSRWTAGQNLNVNFENAIITGVISSATQHHTNVAAGDLITPDTRGELGEVTAVPTETLSNGVLVSLDGESSWTVTGTSYISSLSLADGASVTGLDGKNVQMTVDGVVTDIETGTYTGIIALTLVDETSTSIQDDEVAQSIIDILVEKTSNPELWIEFIKKNKDDAIGQFLQTLIEKLTK